MQARMTMPIDTTFGNTITIEVASELDNPHDLSNEIIFADMAKMIRKMLAAIRNEGEKSHDEGERERLLRASTRERKAEQDREAARFADE